MTAEEKGRKGFAVIAAKYGTACACRIIARAKAEQKRKSNGMIQSSASKRDTMYSHKNLRNAASAYYGADIGAIDL